MLENNACVAFADCLDFFQKGMPERTEKNFHVQLGVHLEEVGEMLDAVTALDEETLFLMSDCRIALTNLGNHLKQSDHVVTLQDDNRIDYCDALADQLVTGIGCSYLVNIDLEGAFSEVNESNLSKFDANGDPIFDENGKIAKGPHYKKADLSPFV